MKPILSTLSAWFYQRATGITLLIFVALEMLFAGWLLPYMQLQMGDGVDLPRPLDLSFGFSPEQAQAFLGSLSERGRQVYLQVETVVDSIYPLIYTTLFILLISYFYQRAFVPGSAMRWFNLAPLVTMLADFTENSGIILLILAFPEPNELAARIATTGNYIKWGTSAACVLLLLVGIGAWAGRLLRKTTTP